MTKSKNLTENEKIILDRRTKEFSLSEKIFERRNLIDKDLLKVKDVKEFIKRLKECFNGAYIHNEQGVKVLALDFVIMNLNKLAGDKLI